MYGSGSRFKDVVEAQHAVVGGAALAGADGDGSGKAAFALDFCQWRDKVLAYGQLVGIDSHKRVGPGMFPGLIKAKGKQPASRPTGIRFLESSHQWAPLEKVLARKGNSAKTDQGCVGLESTGKAL